VLCAAGARVLPELRRFFRRRNRILYAGPHFPSSGKMTRKQYEMVNGKTNVKQLFVTANCQLLLMNSS
jgi:sigma54-dependent transcription regulator